MGCRFFLLRILQSLIVDGMSANLSMRSVCEDHTPILGSGPRIVYKKLPRLPSPSQGQVFLRWWRRNASNHLAKWPKSQRITKPLDPWIKSPNPPLRITLRLHGIRKLPLASRGHQRDLRSMRLLTPKRPLHLPLPQAHARKRQR
jgi:hypothetical protein